MAWYPSNREQCSNALWLAYGLVIGWITHPGIWPVYWTPIRWVAFQLAQASQEGLWTADIGGDAGASVGILQFNVANVRAGLVTDAERRDPLRSGVAAARLVSASIWGGRGLDGDRRWLFWLVLPFLGWPYLRHLWTHGAGGLDSDGGVVAVVGHALSETERGLPAVLVLRGVSLVPLAVGWLWVRR